MSKIPGTPATSSPYVAGVLGGVWQRKTITMVKTMAAKRSTVEKSTVEESRPTSPGSGAGEAAQTGTAQVR